MPDTRYQVFVSSTFRDLVEERREVMQSLLEMDCIPSGMELFPAADANAWALIERVIRQSDYYVLIIGGRYGTVDVRGIGYTEREYHFAVECGKTVLPFLHEHPENIPAGKTELIGEARVKLEAFRKVVQERHHCKYWNNPEQLGGQVARAINMALKLSPAVGWVRGDLAKTVEDAEELAAASGRIAELMKEIEELRLRLATALRNDEQSKITVRDFDKAFGSLLIEWDIQANGEVAHYPRCKQLLQSLYQSLLDLVADAKHTEDVHIALMIRSLLKDVSKITESYEKQGFGDEEFLTRSKPIVQQIESLRFIIESSRR